ncbi:unnamed protein product, partial [marine sediment metagenome]
MDKASQENLKLLHDSASDVYGRIIAGADPKVAVVKVASEAEYSQEWTGRLCEITNRLLAVDHIEHSEGEKAAAEHLLINTDDVMAELFPTTITQQSVKAAAESILERNYHYKDLPAPMIKRASQMRAPTQKLGGFLTKRSFLDRTDAVRKSLKRASQMVGSYESDATHELSALCKEAAVALLEPGVNASLIE